MGGGPQPFPPTSWTLIRVAQDPAAPAFRSGLDSLVGKYWGPVYLCVRRHWARDTEEAKDLTQAFFLAFLEKGFLTGVQSDKGRFRNFVCVALRHFLLKQKKHAKAQKRAPRSGLLSLDAAWESGRFPEPAAPPPPDTEEQFREDWKRAVLDAAMAQLRKKAEEVGKLPCVEMLLQYDLGPERVERPTYQSLASAFGLTVFQVTNGLHWARKELRSFVIQEVRDQVASDEDLRDEVRDLLGFDIEETP